MVKRVVVKPTYRRVLDKAADIAADDLLVGMARRRRGYPAAQRAAVLSHLLWRAKGLGLPYAEALKWKIRNELNASL